ncbi:hypothetical protein LDO32_12430 [Luteimonas sp. Y-2-2-4F]|nr:hypothetical protein [Luteimonas sp. Y-2-2-4F]MCD9032531.1 hypothetical protein [Luteimonas sp. Y-2-2-4F]
MNGPILWIAAIIGGTLLVLMFRHHARRKFARSRSLLKIEEIYKEVSGQVEFGVFNEVLIAIGESYRINPGLIRPSDRLEEFIRIDSWRLDAGSEALSNWLERKGINWKVKPASTVLELARLVKVSG